MKIKTTNIDEITWNQVKELVGTRNISVGDEVLDQMTDGEKITYVVSHISRDEVHFISKDCLKRKVWWNKSGVNSGGFIDSDLCKLLNEAIWSSLSEELKSVIIERECLQIVDGKWQRFPLKLWLPTEYEVFGKTYESEAQEGEQFDIFKDPRNRMKLKGENGERVPWWLMSIVFGSSFGACHVGSFGGYGSYRHCNINYWTPVRFTIKR